MYKNQKIIALFSTIAWLAFIFSAFKGFHFWYAGFVFFFWFCLASLNYRHETTLWFFKNRFRDFYKFFIVLFIVGFIADFIIGLKIAHLWAYPFYNSIFDWLRLYLIIYPFGGLSVLELVFFLSNNLREKFVFARRDTDFKTKIIDISDHFVDLYLIVLIVLLPLLYLLQIKLPFRHLMSTAFIIWIFTATAKFAYHIRHGVQWIAILVATVFMAIFLHEIPNTGVFEWRYYNAPFLNSQILGIPLWVFVGWYVLVLVIMRLWVRFLWTKR